MNQSLRQYDGCRKELWKYFTETEHYQLKDGKALKEFMPDWIGEFYAYYQWSTAFPVLKLIAKVPLDFLKPISDFMISI